MTSEHPYTKLREYDRCVAGLMSDPEVTGDLLLIGMWLARATILNTPEPSKTGWQLTDMAAALFPMKTKPAMFSLGEWSRPQVTGPDAWHVFEVLKKDIRRYDPWVDQPGPRWARTLCAGPMVRRATCGKPSVAAGFLTDPETGRKKLRGGCRKHEQWFIAEVQANREACEAVEVPQPPANIGGRLAPHIRDIDWAALWRGIDPNWVIPPEVRTWERPSLRLLLAPDMASQPAPTAAPTRPRPKFALIPGALT
ncbi:hypothetical protein AB0B94_30565 [Micromonospora sp. NPDC048986]|uniref:hypothetical protein n=1 Tax=Micromonospora sp. NPDC048986 TaxID=3155644 RepID=UPI0033C2CA36